MNHRNNPGSILSAFLLAASALGAGCGVGPEEEDLAHAGQPEPLGEAKQDLWAEGGRDVRSGVGPNLCLDVTGGVVAAGTNVQIYSCNGTNSQKWTLTPEGYLRSGLDPNYCLDVSGGGTANGTNVQLYPCNGTNSQRWSYTGRGEFKSALGPNLCLDVAQALKVPGTNVQLYTCNGTVAQQWFDVPQQLVRTLQDAILTISNVKLNRGGNSLVRVQPNQFIQMELSYDIAAVPWCQNCTQQITMGFPDTFLGCIYDATPSTSGTSASALKFLSAPSTPGVYYLRFKLTKESSCGAAVWSNTNEANNIAVITVTDPKNN